MLTAPLSPRKPEKKRRGEDGAVERCPRPRLPYAGEPITSGQLPQSHKEDSANHGFGMKSIRFLAEKYGGTMEFSTADGLFTLQILLPVPA